jgi:endonuclease/exonuclease/phosphatase family metal-dependent hydrolase
MDQSIVWRSIRSNVRFGRHIRGGRAIDSGFARALPRVAMRAGIRSTTFLLIGALMPGCGGGSSPRSESSIVSLNQLHGIMHEDPSGSKYDYYTKRLPLISSELVSRRPAIVFLQEAYLGGQGDYPDLVAALSAALNPGGQREYAMVFGDLLGDPPSDNGGTGLGQLTITRLPIIAKGNHKIAVDPARCVVYVEVMTSFGPMHLFNAHLEGWDDPMKAEAELKEVLAFIESAAMRSETVVLGGDFNRAESDASLHVLRDAGFVDLVSAQGLKCTSGDQSGCTSSTFPLAETGNRTTERIDYMWLRTNSTAMKPSTSLTFDHPYPVDGGSLWASDHIGIASALR